MIPIKKNKYTAWLHWNISAQCNFDCTYCFGKIPVNRSELREIDIEKLLGTLEKDGRIFRISFTGGEPFLIPNIVEACAAITKKHFVSFNSNLVLPNVEKFADRINPERVVFIQASFHSRELEGKKLFDKYLTNFQLLKSRGFEILAEAVAFPTDYELHDKYKIILKENGIDLKFAPFVGSLNSKKYPQSYSPAEIIKYGLDEERIKAHFQKGKLCNAGFNASVVYSNGDVYPCFQIKEKMGSVNDGIEFSDTLRKCPAKFCGCPLNNYDRRLFELGIVSRQ